jgi:hypothetical protein
MSSEWLEFYESTANQIAANTDNHARPQVVAAVKKLDQQLKEMEANPSKFVVREGGGEYTLGCCCFFIVYRH